MSGVDDAIAEFDGGAGRVYAQMRRLDSLSHEDRCLVLVHIFKRHPEAVAAAFLALELLRARQAAEMDEHVVAALRVVEGGA